MINIDYIMDLFDWHNSDADQKKGLDLAKNIKCISVFLQPGYPYGKNVWDNCAKVLAEREDEELEPHLFELFEWLQDLNWPGAYCILERLRKYKDACSKDQILKICLRRAKMLCDEIWEDNLKKVKEQKSGDGLREP